MEEIAIGVVVILVLLALGAPSMGSSRMTGDPTTLPPPPGPRAPPE